MVTQYPRLLDHALNPAGPLLPLQYSLVDKLTPLSTASIVLSDNAPEVSVRSFVELYDEHGSAGVFRVTKIRTDGSGVRTLDLQHGLCTLSDHMHPGESTETGSCRMLLTKILSNQSRWLLGTVDVPDDQDMTWECNNTNDLQGLLAIVKELPGYFLDFDMTAVPWVLHLLAKSTEVDCEARFDRNLTDAQIEYDTTDMCTIAYADGLDAPIKADTFDDWDEIARHVRVDKDIGAELIAQSVERYLEQTKNPRVTITLTALSLSMLTGEPFDHFRKGMLCRCILDGVTHIQRIESIERPDPIGEPMHVVLTLASTQNDLSVTVAGLVVDTRHVNQLYQQLERELHIEADTIDMLAAEILLRATKSEVDGLSTRIAQAEVSLNEALGELALRVTYSDLEDELNEVSLTLDAVNSTLAAKADLILLDGYVKMEDFEAIEGWATDFSGVTISGSSILGGYGDFDTLWCGSLNGESLSTAALSMGSIVSATVWGAGSDINLSHSHAVTVDGGTITLGEVSSSGGSFNIADTQFYRDGVSAARDSVTMTSMGWIGGANVVEASNGKSIRITLPPFSSSGGDAFNADHKTTVYFYTNSVSGPLLSVEIDATSVYEAGYNAAKEAVTVEGGIRSITNTAANYMMAQGWASARLNGEQLDYTTFSGSQYFPSLGQ